MQNLKYEILNLFKAGDKIAVTYAGGRIKLSNNFT
jgi:hypothetical protein